MKLNDSTQLETLSKYGFEPVNEEYKDLHNIGEYHQLASYDDCWIKCIGHARRGQHYYYVVDNATKKFSIVATAPDGEGCGIEMDDTIIELMRDGLLELPKSNYKVGDIVVVTDKLQLNDASDHDFEIGTVVKLISHDPTDTRLTWEASPLVDIGIEVSWLHESEFELENNE